MARHLTNGDRPALAGKFGDVPLHLGVEIDPSLLDEQTEPDAFEILAIRNRVIGVTGTCSSTSASPKPSLQINSPFRMTAIWAPGIRSAAMVSRICWREAPMAPANGAAGS
jgi:hypothetical protein